jgi:hypothetical protein
MDKEAVLSSAEQPTAGWPHFKTSEQICAGYRMVVLTARVVHAMVHPCLHCGQGFQSARVLTITNWCALEAKVRDLGGMRE